MIIFILLNSNINNIFFFFLILFKCNVFFSSIYYILFIVSFFEKVFLIINHLNTKFCFFFIVIKRFCQVIEENSYHYLYMDPTSSHNVQSTLFVKCYRSSYRILDLLLLPAVNLLFTTHILAVDKSNNCTIWSNNLRLHFFMCFKTLNSSVDLLISECMSYFLFPHLSESVG